MKISFSWLKKILEDAERLSSFVALIVCGLVFAGTLALIAEKNAVLKTHEAAEATENAPARIVVRLENFVPVPEPAEIENTPEEPPPPPPPPEPEPLPEEPPVEKIDESALRETLVEVPAPEPPKEEPPPEPELPELKPQETVPLPTPPKQIAPTPPEPEIVIDQAAQIAAEQSLYGALAEAVSKKKFYPRTARRNGRTGTVSVRVFIDAAGKIASYSVEKSSAHRSLVSGAEETLRRVAEDFSAPAGAQAALPATLIVPIIYELN